MPACPNRPAITACRAVAHALRRGHDADHQKMSTMATCPICRSDAEEIEPGVFDGKTFRCPKHGEFDVTGSVLGVRTHMAADSNQWEAALKKAVSRAAAGKRPRTLTYDF